jgi:protein-tyrosine-phosphatase
MPASQAERVAVAVTRRVGAFADHLLRVPPVRRRLRRRALAAWRNTDDPLLVCTGNINRSPLAAALARRRAGSRATSSGFDAVADRPASEQADAAAGTMGVSLAAHRSRRTRGTELEGTGAIFVFDLEHVIRVAFAAPRAVPRTHLLGALAPTGPVSIEDPHGRHADAYSAAFDRIRVAIDAADGGR